MPYFDYYVLGNSCVHKDDAFKVGEIVFHFLYGRATVVKVIDSPDFSDWVFLYIIYTDNKPDKKHKRGSRECPAFHNNLLKAG